MSINNIAKKCYLINLDRRHDRYVSVKKQLSSNNIQFEKFAAVDGNKINNDTNLTNGAHGILLSHIQLLNQCKQEMFDCVAIFEDDIEFCDGFQEKFDKLYPLIPDDWQMIYLGANKHADSIVKDYGNGIIKIRNSYAIHAIILKKDVIIKALEIVVDKQTPVDVYYAHLQDYYPTYSFNPGLCIQKPDWSDIENKFVDYRWLFERNI